jgi:ribosome maturation factor RimP
LKPFPIHQTTVVSCARASRAAIRVGGSPRNDAFFIEIFIYRQAIFRYNPRVFHSPHGANFGDGRCAHFSFVVMDFVELIEKTVAGLGFELVDVEQSPRGRVLRVFIDKPAKLGEAGGVGVEDCAAVSQQLSRVLAVENVDYDRLEISSPGLDRVLKKPADFARFSGSRIDLRLRLAVGERRNFNGVLHGLRDGKVCLTIDTGEIEVDFDNIDKARLVPEFDR